MALLVESALDRWDLQKGQLQAWSRGGTAGTTLL